MSLEIISPFSSGLLRFYANCFVFPYEEMFYELHHLYRTLEQNINNDEDYIHLQKALEIINNFQGMEFRELREEYVRLFTNAVENEPLCPFYANDFLARFTKSIEADQLPEMFYEAGFPFDQSEDADSIINLLEYFSLLTDSFFNKEISEEELISFYDKYLLVWLPSFCETLIKASSINFYREIAEGLNDYFADLR